MIEFKFHHVGIAVADIPAALSNFCGLFGYEKTAGPYEDPIQKVAVCFLSREPGDPQLELVAPLGRESPIHEVLKKGFGTYHICYEVHDLDAGIRHLIEGDSMLISGPVPAIAFQMRPIAWLLTESNLLVELLGS